MGAKGSRLISELDKLGVQIWKKWEECLDNEIFPRTDQLIRPEGKISQVPIGELLLRQNDQDLDVLFPTRSKISKWLNLNLTVISILRCGIRTKRYNYGSPSRNPADNVEAKLLYPNSHKKSNQLLRGWGGQVLGDRSQRKWKNNPQREK